MSVVHDENRCWTLLFMDPVIERTGYEQLECRNVGPGKVLTKVEIMSIQSVTDSKI
jgi:hypothetical protein